MIDYVRNSPENSGTMANRAETKLHLGSLPLYFSKNLALIFSHYLLFFDSKWSTCIVAVQKVEPTKSLYRVLRESSPYPYCCITI